MGPYPSHIRWPPISTYLRQNYQKLVLLIFETSKVTKNNPLYISHFVMFFNSWYLMKPLRVNYWDPHLVKTTSQVNIIHTIRRIRRRAVALLIEPESGPPVKDHAAAAGHKVVATSVGRGHLVAVAFTDCQLFHQTSLNNNYNLFHEFRLL